MKTRKNISKLIGLSLFMSNFSIYSGIATYNGEIPNRYETLEGEYITIDNSTEGEIKSIEISGNTVQDENNLENIQSVEDLYTDENGNPILDSQGRKQYKINIVSQNKNLFDSSKVIRGSLINIYDEININASWFYTDYIKVKKGTYSMGDYKRPFDNYYCHFYDLDKNHIGYGEDVGFAINGLCTFSQDGYIRLSGELKYIDQGQLEIGNKLTEYEPYKEEKITILSPTPLEKVGDTSDKIIKKNGIWGVEKNIETVIFNDDEKFSNYYFGNDYYSITYLNNTNLIDVSEYSPCLISSSKFLNHTAWISSNFLDGNVAIFNSSNIQGYFEIAFKRDLGQFNSIDDCVNYIKNNNFYFKSILKTPKFIPLAYNQEIKLNTFANKTHIFSQTENGVNPTLKVTVDRLDRMALDAVDEVEVNPTIENLNTARNLVNHVNESNLKEQLQQRLNEITDLNDLQLERKTFTSNVDIYIKSENMLSMTLSTSNITFEDYSGVSDLEQTNAIEISINSSLPYQLNSYLESKIKNTDGINKIDVDRLNIKDSEDTNYKEFTDINKKLVLKDNCISGNNLFHYIDLKLKGGDAYPSDIYKTVIKFEAEQK